jgi:hypothetical protein
VFEEAKPSDEKAAPAKPAKKPRTGPPRGPQHGALPKATGQVIGGPGQFVAKPPETDAGKNLVDKIAADPDGKKVGLRSVVNMLADFLETEVRVGKAGTTAKNPAHQMGDGYDLIRSRSGSWQLNLHEIGHALHQRLLEADPDALNGLDDPLVDLSEQPDSFASASSSAEGFAEWVRRFLFAPQTLPAALSGRLEAVVEQTLPGTLPMLRDAHRAIQRHAMRGVQAQAESIRSDRPAASSLTEDVGRVSRAFHWSLTRAINAEHALRNTIMDPIARAVGQKAAALTSAIRLRLEQFEAAANNTYHVAQEASRAMFGHDDGDPRGFRVRADRSDHLDHILDKLDPDERAAFSNRFRLDRVSGGARRGDFLYLNGADFKEILDAIGRDRWDSFDWYVLHREALARYEKSGHAYPGLTEGLTPEVLKGELDRIEAANPDFATQRERLQDYMQQTVLIGVLMGQFTPADAMRIVNAREEYAPLLRLPEPGEDRMAGSSGTKPTSPVRRAFGSALPFRPLADSVDRMVTEAIGAYYRNRTIWSVNWLRQQVAGLPGIPREAVQAASRALVPIRLSWKKVANLRPDEKRMVMAQEINALRAQEAGVPLDQFLAAKEGVLEPDDIVLVEPGIETPIFRQDRPNAVRVVAAWADGRQHFFEVADPMLFDYFARSRAPAKAAAAVAKVLGEVNDARRRGATQTWAFTVSNFIRDRIGTASFSLQWDNSLVPSAHATAGIVGQLTGKKSLPGIQEAELYASVSAATHSKRHKDMWDKLGNDFKNMLQEGLYVPGWSGMGGLDRAAHLPGVAISSVQKARDIVNWLTGSRLASAWSERLSRSGAYKIAIDQGQSQEVAQLRHDKVSGYFVARPGSASFAAYYRAALFLNPNLQTLYQTYRILTDPLMSRQNKAKAAALAGARVGFRMTQIALVGGAMAALWNWLFCDDDDRDRLAERQSEERMTAMNIKIPGTSGFIRLPFAYGPEGAFQSFGYNLMEGYLIDKNVRSDAAIQSLLSRAASVPEVSGLLTLPGQLTVELWANKTFFGNRPIVPQGLERLYQDTPHLQYTPKTPEWAVWLGEKIGVSPIKLEYAARQIVMPAAMEGINLPDRLERGINEPSELPLVGRLFAYEPTGFWSESGRELADRARKWDALTAERRRLYEGTEDRSDRIKEIEAELDGLAGASRNYRKMEKWWKQIRLEMNKDNPDRTAIRAMEQKMTAMARSYLKDGGDESDRVSDRLSARLRGLEQRDDMDKLDRAERGEMVHLRGIMSRIGDVRNRVEAGGITADAGQDRVKALAAESAAPWAAGYRRLLGRHAELDKEKRQADLRGARPSPSVMQQLGSIQSRLNEVDKLRKLLNDNKMTPAMFNSAVAYITKE